MNSITIQVGGDDNNCYRKRLVARDLDPLLEQSVRMAKEKKKKVIREHK